MGVANGRRYKEENVHSHWSSLKRKDLAISVLSFNQLSEIAQTFLISCSKPRNINISSGVDENPVNFEIICYKTIGFLKG